MLRAILVGLLTTSSTGIAAERVVRQIGEADRDYSEFAFAGNYPECAKHFGAKPRRADRTE